MSTYNSLLIDLISRISELQGVLRGWGERDIFPDRLGWLDSWRFLRIVLYQGAVVWTFFSFASQLSPLVSAYSPEVRAEPHTQVLDSQ